jgi:hypothetical protein
MSSRDGEQNHDLGGIPPKAIREEVGRILAHPLFSKSRRYPTFLRHIIECSLAGDAERLKERTIGIELFDRKADYETETDPIVRVTAGEIRKRLTEYYQQEGASSGIRIELLAGSYSPVIRSVPASAPQRPSSNQQKQAVPDSPVRRRSRLGLILTCTVLSLVILALVGRPWWSRSALQQFWGPLLASPGPVLICLPTFGENFRVTSAAPIDLKWVDRTAKQEVPMVGVSIEQLLTHLTSVGEALNVARTSTFLAGKGKPSNTKAGSTLTLADLTQGPAVLIGGYTNDWTLQLMTNGRFRFDRDGLIEFIRDDQNPAFRGWGIDESKPRDSMDRDYAIVSRVVEPTTGRIIVLIAGLRTQAETAATDFLTDPTYFDALAPKLPKDWRSKNLQIVISTKVINGSAGQPVPLATFTW